MAELKAPTKGEQTRNGLLDAAHELFLVNGFHGTGMRDIAKAAGLTLSGIYNHFGSKEDIFVAVVKAYHPYHDMFLAMTQARGKTAEAYFRDAARRTIAALRARPKAVNLLLIELVEFEGTHVPGIIEEIYPELLRAFSRVQEYTPELRRIPLPVMLRAFLGLFFSFYITDVFAQNSVLSETRADWFGGMVDIYLHGVLDRSPG